MNNAYNSTLFEETPIPKAVGKLVVPTILSSLVMVFYNLADTYFVGQLNNAVQNAAVTLAAPVLLAFNAVNNLFGVGSSSMMSRALGRKEYDIVRKSASFGLYCSFASGLLFSLLCLCFFQPLLGMLGADAETARATADYLKWTVICGAAPSILNVVLAYLVRAEGNSLQASVGTMSGCLLNIVLDPIFIFPWGLNMGAAGAGLATFLSNCAACAYFFVLLYRRRAQTLISLNPRHFRFDRRIAGAVCGVGVPAAIQNLLNVTGMTVLNNFTASYGASVVAAMGIAQKIYMVPMQIALGGTQGVMPLVSYSYTAKNYDRFRTAIAFLARFLIPAMLVVAAAGWFCAPTLIRLFISNADVLHYGTLFLRALIIAVPFLVLDFLVVGICQAIGRGFTSLVFAILRKVVLEIPATVALNAAFGVTALAYGAFTAELVMSVTGAVTLLRIFKKFKASLPAPSGTTQQDAE